MGVGKAESLFTILRIIGSPKAPSVFVARQDCLLLAIHNSLYGLLMF